MGGGERVIMVGTLAQSLWMLTDGVRCLVNGHYQGRMLTAAESLVAEGVVVELPDGSFIEYGPWAMLPSLLGIHPHAFAPLFLGLGVAGVVALGLYLMKRPMGWHAVLAFSIASLWYLLFGTLVSLLVIGMLMLPSVRHARLGATSPP